MKERDFETFEKINIKKKIVLALCGALIGFVNGFFGGGGGMICVPLLEGVLGFKNKVAHATTLLVIFPISLVSAAVYLLNGDLEFLSFATTATGVVVGGIFGAFALKVLPEKIVRILFVGLMIYGGIRLMI